MVGRILKDTSYFLRDLCTYPLFSWSHKTPAFLRVLGVKIGQADYFRGVFPDYKSALAALPPNQPQGFDSEDAPDYWLKNFSHFRNEDYPVLLWLEKILQPDDRLFDLGGGFGQTFYAYSKYLVFPAGMRWCVCDVASFTRYGESLALERGFASSLSFTNDWKAADGSTIYLTNGTLQYLEPGLAEILSDLKSKPRHVLVNRVPAYPGETFFTIQSGHVAFCPYKIMNAAELIRAMKALGYDLIDQWHYPRTTRVPLHPRHTVPSYLGFYFALA
jgi:putative methyltransferase (TIGR04325 family)